MCQDHAKHGGAHPYLCQMDPGEHLEPGHAAIALEATDSDPQLHASGLAESAEDHPDG